MEQAAYEVQVGEVTTKFTAPVVTEEVSNGISFSQEEYQRKLGSVVKRLTGYSSVIHGVVKGELTSARGNYGEKNKNGHGLCPKGEFTVSLISVKK